MQKRLSNYVLSLKLSKVLFTTLALSLAGTASVWAHGPAAEQAPGHSQAEAAQAQSLTQQLVSLNARYEGAAPEAQARLLAQMIDVAAQRQDLLAALMDAAPGEVLKTALPSHLRDRMPTDVQDWLAMKLDLEGEFQILHVDGDEPDQSGYRYYLETAFGERISLHFAGKAPALLSGSEISARGLLLEGTGATGQPSVEGAMSVASEDDVLVLGAGGGGSGGGPQLTDTFGEQRTVVLMVNFLDDTSQPYTSSYISSVMNGDVNDFMLENSYDQTWVTTDIFGWYTLPLTKAGCDIFNISSAAKQAAMDAGVNLGPYSRFIYVFPKNGCPGAGMGTVGGNPSDAWIYGSFTWSVVAHELGHNLGLYHSNNLDCGNQSIGSSCTVNEYGDLADLMGTLHTAHFNAYQKDRLGWLGYGSSPAITVADSSGSYTIDPYATSGSAPKAVKILKDTDAATGETTWYYFEYRQPIGFDSGLNSFSSANLTDGALAHSGSDTNGDRSYLLDMTPADTTFINSALEPGQSFTDDAASVTVTTDWADAGGLQLSVSYDGAPTCTNANPQISMTPSESQWVSPGTLVTYTVTVTNKDSSACNSAEFNLSSSVPGGWNANLANSSLTLAPGASGSTTLDVTSSSSANDGFYSVTATAVNSQNVAYAASDTATYVVSSPSNQAPVAANDSAATNENSSTNITVLDNDSDPDGDPLSVTLVTAGSNGSTVLKPNKTVTYSPNTGFSGSDSFTYSISDGNGGSDSATVWVTVNGVNDPPVAVDDSDNTLAGQPVTISVLNNDSDPDGDPLIVASKSSASNGSVTRTNSNVTYAPNAGFSGTDSFTYTVSDGNGGSDSATVTVTVTATNANEAPVAVNDSAETAAGVPVTVAILANDFDPEGDTITIVSVDQGKKGSVVVNANNTITYTPSAGAKGKDNFTYTIQDSAGNSASAKIQITLTKQSGGKPSS